MSNRKTQAKKAKEVPAPRAPSVGSQPLPTNSAENRSHSPASVPHATAIPMQVDNQGNVFNSFGADYEAEEQNHDEHEEDDPAKGLEKMMENVFTKMFSKFGGARRQYNRRASSHSGTPRASRSPTPVRRAPREKASASSAPSSASQRSEREKRQKKRIADLEEKLKAGQKACSCKTAAACSGGLCGCKNDRQVGCGEHCGCQKTDNGCFNPYTREEMAEKYKKIPRGGLLFKELENDYEQYTSEEDDEE